MGLIGEGDDVALGDIDPVGALVGLASFLVALAALLITGIRTQKPFVRGLVWTGVVVACIGALVFGLAMVGTGAGTPSASQAEAGGPPTPPTSGSDASPTSAGTAPDAARQYVSALPVADSYHASSTGHWDTGLQTINGTSYGHSVGMNAGCQNDDGGDFWIDYALPGQWATFESSVGVSDSSSTQSAGRFSVRDAVTGTVLAEGAIRAGEVIPVHADLTGVTRLRLFMNDPNAASQSCGFVTIRTTLVWGDAVLGR